MVVVDVVARLKPPGTAVVQQPELGGEAGGFLLPVEDDLGTTIGEGAGLAPFGFRSRSSRRDSRSARLVSPTTGGLG